MPGCHVSFVPVTGATEALARASISLVTVSVPVADAVEPFCCASYSPPVEQISACACGICGLFHASAIRLTFSLCDRFLCAAQAGPPGWPDLGRLAQQFSVRSLALMANLWRKRLDFSECIGNALNETVMCR
jgi:hypothetical protein